MVSLPITIWAWAAGAMKSAPTATATAFLFIFPPPRGCSLMRNIDLEHGTAGQEATSDASRRQVHARFSWLHAMAQCGNLRKRDPTVRTHRRFRSSLLGDGVEKRRPACLDSLDRALE